MPRETTSVSREDYLKAIWELAQEDHAPIGARLAEELGVTPPAVTAALKRMTRDGLLRIDRDGHIRLTRQGPRGSRAAGAAPPTRRETADRSDRSASGLARTTPPSGSNTASLRKSRRC